MTMAIRAEFKNTYGFELKPETNEKFVAQLLSGTCTPDERLNIVAALNKTDEGCWANLFKYDTSNIENLDLNTINFMRAFYADAVLDLPKRGYKPQSNNNPISSAVHRLLECIGQFDAAAGFNRRNFSQFRPEVVVSDVTPSHARQRVDMTEVQHVAVLENVARRLFS